MKTLQEQIDQEVEDIARFRIENKRLIRKARILIAFIVFWIIVFGTSLILDFVVLYRHFQNLAPQPLWILISSGLLICLSLFFLYRMYYNMLNTYLDAALGTKTCKEHLRVLAKLKALDPDVDIQELLSTPPQIYNPLIPLSVAAMTTHSLYQVIDQLYLLESKKESLLQLLTGVAHPDKPEEPKPKSVKQVKKTTKKTTRKKAT